MEYDFQAIEKKWQQQWRDSKIYKVTEDKNKQKYYALDMFPYPSGAGLHVGHPLGYIASDIIARYKRHQGFNVLHPMGYDSFGLPAEQYAIQTGQHPAITTETNIARYREQLDKIGFAYDWDREVRTSDPDYYRWTQWIFGLIFESWYNLDTNKTEPISTLITKFEANGTYAVNAFLDEDWYTQLDLSKFHFGKNFEGDFTATDWQSLNEEQQQMILMHYRLAFIADSVVNWCPALGTVLANDEIKDGKSERGGHPVVQKMMRQWSMRITAFSQRLLDGLDTIDWPENIKEVQRNWIGRSEGASVQFKVDGHDANVEVFTTRPDTIFGVSFMTLAPEHELVLQITTDEYREAVEQYIANAKLKTERDRQADVKNVSGQFTGAYVIHPFTGNKIPIWIGEYVLAGYGTGAVMAVPAGDQRDWDFAKKFNLPIPNIFEGVDISEKAEPSKEAKLANSDFLNGMKYKEATSKVIAEMEARGFGKGKINYRMRDAVFSRQRYWGEPFPIYYKGEIPYLCDDDDLPIDLPPVDKYLPTEDGEPPLARAKDWGYLPHSNAHGNRPHPQPLSGGEGSAEAHSDEGSAKWEQWKGSNPETWKILKSRARDMRKNPTVTEDLIWQNIRNHKLGHKIRRQHTIKEFIVDFVCLDRRLIIEIDGSGHSGAEQKIYDEARSLLFGFLGFKTIRFTNEEVKTDLKNVLEKIKSELDNRPSIKTDARSPLSTGEGSGVRSSYRMEYNTMPGWAGSSWYFLRYMDAKNSNEFASREKIDYWNQVDLYMGGAEHATGHLLYSRFWTKILFDLGYIGFDEPFKKMINQGMILGRSSFVYDINREFVLRIFKGFSVPSEVAPLVERSYDNIDIPNIFVSANIVHLLQSGNMSDEDYIKLDERIKEIFIRRNPNAHPAIEMGLMPAPTNPNDALRSLYSEVRKMPVSIDLVNNDVLNTEEFKLSIFGDPEAEFIVWDNGEYICSWEIEKMSKSKYNVQTPDELVEKFGADTLRMYEMFLGPVEQSKPWDIKGINGVHNFLRKYWRLSHGTTGSFEVNDNEPAKAELKTLHTAIKKVSEDLNRYSWNTVVSTLMICVNELTEQKCNNREVLKTLTILLSPYAPHIAEELWEKLTERKQGSVIDAEWPLFNESYLIEANFEYPISFNGKTRYFLSLPVEMSGADVEAAVRSNESTEKYLEGKPIKKMIVVPKRIVNVVV